ncbi:hypothetical protein NX801_09260 [Streptomyces sp. LP05-1]|uniref:Uncharacterized protein n=1 Tax=Streptomyces pyxinae TaxID=2970734 RepID=A0ABT2CGL7_9ACTN|nr:hypothetical protein [Streptomyces sp. LP05-1]MCS0635851.1 hypothetical protein [Streptomyces sp. LP05-1]
MRKTLTAVLTGLFGIALFAGLPANHTEARAMTFDPNACLDLSEVMQCKNHVLWKHVPVAGPYPKGTCRPYVAVKAGKC